MPAKPPWPLAGLSLGIAIALSCSSGTTPPAADSGASSADGSTGGSGGSTEGPGGSTGGSGGSTEGPGGRQSGGPPYPRLALLWPNPWTQPAQELARFDLVIWGAGEDDERVAAVDRLNASQIGLTALNATELHWSGWGQGASAALLSQIPAEWFLTQQGSTLAASIDAAQTEILVEATRDRSGAPLFEAGDTLACGLESFKVLAVDHAARRITVERGFVRPARAHEAGQRVAAHVIFWPKTWVMNLSTLCPLVDVGNGPESWSDWYLRNIFDAVPNLRDGVFLDRTSTSESWMARDDEWPARSIDPGASNRPVDDGYQAFDLAWRAGLRDFLGRFRQALGRPLLTNDSGYYRDLNDGSLFESVPGNLSDTLPERYADWAGPVLDQDYGYIEVSTQGAVPNYSIIETYEIERWLDPDGANPFDQPGFQPDQQRMRFGLSTALLGDGYFAYTLNTVGQSALGLMWFDEYDNAGAGKGYLGHPLGGAVVLADYGEEGVVMGRAFEAGVVVCNPSDRAATIDLLAAFGSPFRRIAGAQAPEINTGEGVTTLDLSPRDGRILLR